MAPRLHRSPDHDKLARKRAGMNPFTAGAILLVIAAVGTFLGFTKHIPFTHGYRLSVVIPSANSIRVNSPVRIAGVNVGKVTGVKQYDKIKTAAVVQMELQDNALPIHKDATVKLRPRIFLEGNYFLDLRPGTPSAKTLSTGSTLPITQASNAVQLDQVLTALQSDARKDLQDVVTGLGDALTKKPTAVQDADQDPSVRGLSAAQAFNQTYKTSAQSLKATSQVNEGLLGTEPHDLSKLISGFGRAAGGLDRNEAALAGLVTSLNTTTAALASQQANLRASIRQLAPTLETTNRALTSLDAALPPTSRFAHDILPGVRETASTIDAAFPWIRATRQLLGENELRGLARDLRPASASLARLTDRSIALLPQLDLINKCISRVILPTGDIVVNEGGLTTGSANYKDFWYSMVGLAGEGQNFDGNGMYVRFSTGLGDQTVSTGASSLSGDQLFGSSATRPLGTRPRYTGKRPPYVSTKPCFSSGVPDVNGSALSRAAPGERVIGRTVPKPTPRTKAPGAKASAAGSDSVADQLASRLNPFRDATVSAP